ncbi:DUF397 domain-containing protein [Streptomyces europaeiscabiei]|uniref:DUF397 domain-containing protein n=1 Tax=Streptomyces europaeiscabiei TaxID=146819 RepID=A0ABU4NRA3_9ACTN|nr:DUF397 domain-containing protein [Streptomyces europaeiscabiei]MDX3547188.1 DUF397 domain-containing protein [Streptomyces europaeiscabiei]MDX3556891.1 DUF397 domain-containing protein [Streptomyces europaeiscabiei]MDX3704597.1 DUF397 domain-containing protein [Streptomyces europaeiscabiei]
MSTRYDLSAADWRKSSYSDGQGGSCVEVADGFLDVVPVRDSKIAEGAAILIRNAGWSTFVSAVKDGSITRS